MEWIKATAYAIGVGISIICGGLLGGIMGLKVIAIMTILK